MFINTATEENFKGIQAQEVEWVRREILSLPTRVQKLIREGELAIDECLEREKKDDPASDPEVNQLNVFDLEENVPGDVLKCLAMLYTAAGFHHVKFESDCFGDPDASAKVRHVKFPNNMSMRAHR